MIFSILITHISQFIYAGRWPAIAKTRPYHSLAAGGV